SSSLRYGEKDERTNPAVFTYALYLYFNSRSSRLAATNPWQPPKKKKRRSRYGRKPIFTHIHTYTHTDGARCYNEACSGWLRLRRYVYGTELKKKNLMERFIQQVKDRTEFSTTISCVERGIATGSMCGTGSNCSCYIWT
ncbi:MAG TPA: hypothetical protein VNI77_03005, partial [Nitrososphaera sp.]|nr:hypothetical protein [Nitrososphaera sp.]